MNPSDALLTEVVAELEGPDGLLKLEAECDELDISADLYGRIKAHLACAALAAPVSELGPVDVKKQSISAATRRMAATLGCDFVLNDTSVSVADVIEGEVERVADILWVDRQARLGCTAIVRPKSRTDFVELAKDRLNRLAALRSQVVA